MNQDEFKAWREMARSLRIKAADLHFEGKLEIPMNRTEFRAAMFTDMLVGQRDKNKTVFYFLGLEVKYDKTEPN